MDLEVAVQSLSQLAASTPARRGSVRVEQSLSRYTIVLDNPDRRNAMTCRMMAGLARAVLELQSWSGSLVVLRSAQPGMFCSGGHLGEVRAHLLVPDHAAVMAEGMRVVLDSLRAHPSLSISAIEGPAVGGGAEMVTACDLRVGTPEAFVQFVQGRLGVAPGWGGAGRLRDIVGRQVALRWLVSSERLDMEACTRAGLVDAVGADVDELIARFERPASVNRALKAQLGAGSRTEETEHFLGLWGGVHHRAALGEPT